MTLSIGTTGDPLHKLVKSIDFPEGLTLSGNLKDDCDICDPVIEIETTTNLSGYNYAHIPEFGRYYYINKIENIGAKFWRLTMHVDVLHTYHTQLLNCECIAANSYNRFNMYLPDANYKAYQNDKILVNKFPSGFDRTHARFVLTAFCDVSSAGPITREDPESVNPEPHDTVNP